MSKNQSSAQSAVEGELSLDDLEKIAGGAGDDHPVTFTITNDSPLPNSDTTGSVLVPTCNMQNSRMGAPGTEDLFLTGKKPMNLSMQFP